MQRWSLMLAAAAAVTAAAAVPAMAGVGGEAARLESARANARAGGPVSEADADLLRRYGCLSGTDNDFCRRLEGKPRSTKHRRPRKQSDD